MKAEHRVRGRGKWPQDVHHGPWCHPCILALGAKFPVLHFFAPSFASFLASFIASFFTRMFRVRALASRRFLNHGKPQNPSYNELAARIDPIKRTGESIEVMRARLTYQARKRGILESDLLLSRFASKRLHSFSQEELQEFDLLLDEADWDIYYWATKNYDVTPLPEKWRNSKILGLLQEDTLNNNGEILRMPDLPSQ